MYHDNRRNRRGKGLTIFSVSLVLVLLGTMIAIIVYPGMQNPTSETPSVQTSDSVSAATTPPPSTSPTAVPNVDLIANPFVQIAQQAGPSVVSISNKIHWFVDQKGSLGDLVQSSGSGVVFSQDGYIITNQHVIEGADVVTVIMADGEEYTANVVGEDATSDLAVLKIDKDGLIPAKIGSSSAAQVGEFVLAIGSPLGNQLFGSVTLGIISAKERMLDLTDSNRMELIQTDAAINPGNSGGALYNVMGELIGINTIKYSYSNSGVSTEGLGFAIPIDNAIPIVEELIANGKIARPALGIGLVMIDSYTAQSTNVPIGVLVRTVFDGSPADKAGVREMDIITHIDNKEIEIFADLTSVLNAKKFDDRATLTIYREGKTLELTVTLFQYENPAN